MKKIFITGSLLVGMVSASICQNVGIGTNSPSEKLQVAGNVKADILKSNGLQITPNAGAGKILTSDGAGNGTWQSLSMSGPGGAGSWGDCSMNGLGNYQALGDSSGAGSDHFGYKVAISGDFAIASSPFDDIGANTDQGSVSFFHFNGTNWDLMQKISEPTGTAGDYFGAGVSISGNYAIIGIIGDDNGANTNQGSAHIYFYNGSNWVFLQKIMDPTGALGDLFGTSVSMDGNFAIVGANEDDIGPNANQGSACIFQLSGGNWVFMQKINDMFGHAEDLFGGSVAISGNNIIVSEPAADVTTHIDQGAVLFYYFNGSTWVLRGKLTDAVGQAGDQFGYSVSISGNNAVVGSPVYDWQETDQGSVNVYRLNGANWDFVQKIMMEEPGDQDGFGYSVSISGNYLMAGAFYDNVGTTNNKGSATIYERIGVGWSKLQFVHDKMGTTDDEFGFAVAIDGSTKRFMANANGYINGSGKIVFGKLIY